MDCKEATKNTDVGIIVIGDYDDNIYVNKICNSSNTSSHSSFITT